MFRPPSPTGRENLPTIINVRDGLINIDGIGFFSIMPSASRSRLSEFGVVLAMKVNYRNLEDFHLFAISVIVVFAFACFFMSSKIFITFQVLCSCFRALLIGNFVAQYLNTSSTHN